MGHKEHTDEDTRLKNCQASDSGVISNGLDKDRCREAEKIIPLVSDIVSGITYGLKSASHYRVRLQKEIEDILERQSFSILPAPHQKHGMIERRGDS